MYCGEICRCGSQLQFYRINRRRALRKRCPLAILRRQIPLDLERRVPTAPARLHLFFLYEAKELCQLDRLCKVLTVRTVVPVLKIEAGPKPGELKQIRN